MSIFLDLGNVSTQLNAATAATLNNVLTAFESLSFFNKSISAQNVCTNLEYQSYPLLVKYQLERTRNEKNAPIIEEINTLTQEVSALEAYDTNINSKITISKPVYDSLYSTQLGNLITLNTNLVKQNQKSLVDLDTYQKSITSTLNTSNQALTLRQSITNRLITDLTPVSVPISKARLNTFIERNANTLLHLTTAVNGITAEIQSAKLLINNSFSTLNTTYITLSSRLKSENTAITTNVNSYTRNAINTAARLRLTGVGNNTSGVLGYRYTAGKLTNGNLTIGGVAFVFRKGLATRNNLLCNGWLGSVYYVDGFSTTLPNTGTGRWNNSNYINGIKLQGSFSTGYYNNIPGVSSLKTIPPNVVQQAKDNKKWYNYYPGQITDLNALSQLNVQEYNRVYFIPHITGTLSDNYQLNYGAFNYNEAYEPFFINTRTPYDDDVHIAEGLVLLHQDISHGEYYDNLLSTDGYLIQFLGDLQECRISLTSLLTAVTGATGNMRESIIQSHFNTFKYYRESLGYYFRQAWESYVTQDFLLIHHNNFSPTSWADTITSNFMGTNIPLSPISLSLMTEFEIFLGYGHNGNYQELPNSALSGIRGVSHTLSEVISGDTLGDGSNQGVKPILDKIIDVHFPTITQRLIGKLSTLCVSFSTTAPAPVYAQDFIFLSGGSELDIRYSIYDDWGSVNFTSYLSSWTAFQVDVNGVAQPFTGTYTTFIRTDENNLSGYYDVNFENGTYVFAPSTDGSGGSEPEPEPGPERGVMVSLNADYNLYTSTGFKIYALLLKNTVLDEEAIETIKDAIDFLAFTLRRSKVNGILMPSMLYKPSIEDFIVNPLYPTIQNPSFSNDGYVLLIDELNANNPILGTAYYTQLRSLTELIIDNTDSKLLPCAGSFCLNMYYRNSFSDTDPLKRTFLYNVVLHELLHAFGVGSSWFTQKPQNSDLLRSYIVGVGEVSLGGDDIRSPYGNPGNIFYSTYDNQTRTETDSVPVERTYPLSWWGDATYPTAYGVARNTLNEVGSAVRFYRGYFNSHITPTPTNNLTLTAVPVESGIGGGSYGGHWAEGQSIMSNSSNQGLDNRYIGVSTCVAPVLFDEIMTPIAEDPHTSVSPITKITLGALHDIGWVVDMSVADEWLPTTHILTYSTLNYTISVNMYCTGGVIDTVDTPFGYHGGYIDLPFRPGVRYTIVNDPINPTEGAYKLTLVKGLLNNGDPVVSLSAAWGEQWVTTSTSPHYKNKGMLTFKVPLSGDSEHFHIVAYNPAIGVPTNLNYQSNNLVFSCITTGKMLRDNY